MGDLREMEDKIRSYIEKEILQMNFLERPRDPLGLSIYAFFLLRNKITSPALDNIIDWLNSWIDFIINKEKISRFVDREVTSAIFGYYVLKINGLLKTEINENKLAKLLSLSVSDNLYFGNMTYSILILLSLADRRYDVPSFDRVLERIKDYIEERTIVNDAKNLVFTSILLERLKDESGLSKLVEICFRNSSERNVRFDDRIYYAWILWNYRRLKEENLPFIRDFVENALRNTLHLLDKEEVNESVKDIYGNETKIGVSRILLAISLDLLINFTKYEFDVSPCSYIYIKKRLHDLGWSDAWKEIERSLKAFKEERMSDCCNNLRMGLLLVWKNVYEKLEKKPAPVSLGKTVDIASLKVCLKAHNFPDDTIGLIERSWSFLSERAHIEKRNKQPPDYEVRFSLQLTFSVVEYLLRFLDQKYG